LAESWGVLGELLAHLNRTAEARRCLENSQAINRRTGSLVGMGVVEGLIGEVDLAEGKLEQAETSLQNALGIARRVGNRWREAWVLERLSRLAHARGRSSETQ